MWFLHFNSLEQMITKNMASLKVDMHNLEFLEVKEKGKKPRHSRVGLLQSFSLPRFMESCIPVSDRDLYEQECFAYACLFSKMQAFKFYLYASGAFNNN